MESLHTPLLYLHILTGGVGLLSGTLNLLLKKHGSMHRSMGLVFAISMLLAGIFALMLALINPNPFLLIVGIFTIYQVSTGYRYIRMRVRGANPGPSAIDWILSLAMALVSIIFLVSGGLKIFTGDLFGIVYLVFGGISILFVRADVINYRGKAREENFWQTAHLQRMTGAYIAALTAFLVVNAQIFPDFIPNWLGWLLPTIVLTPLIVFWSRKYGVLKKSTGS